MRGRCGRRTRNCLFLCLALMEELHDLVVLYESIMKGKTEEVIANYEKFQKPLPHPLTPRHDSILHVAIYMGHEGLVRAILTRCSDDPTLLIARNTLGDTILHEAAATNMTSLMRDHLLPLAPELLHCTNDHGETPLFRAAHYGQTEMFRLLAHEVEEKVLDVQLDLLRNDKTTILHMAVLAENFDLALEIARKYEYLASSKDGNGMIALQLLSSIPSAFKSGSSYGLFKRFIYYCVPSDSNRGDANESDQGPNKLPPNYDVCVQCFSMVVRTLILVLRKINTSIWGFLRQGWPMMKRIYKEKRKHDSAFKLASFLIQKDFSWTQSGGREDPGKISILKGEGEGKRKISQLQGPSSSYPTGGANEGGIGPGNEGATAAPGMETQPTDLTPPSLATGKGIGGGNEGTTPAPKKETPLPLTPLFLATKKGIVEIVTEILRVYPQAVEHVSHEGQNILHVAIKHRQLEIFRHVKKMDIPKAMLVRRFDNEGYSILHHVGHKPVSAGGRTQPGPAFQLQEELRWLKRVRKITPGHYQMHRSKKEEETADELFEKNHGNLLKEAQEWLMRTTESCSTVSVLIATVAFAAAYTVPGGSNQDTGVPILLHDPFFLVFTVMDVLSLASSLTSVVMFLSILTSPFQLQDFRHSLPRKLILGFTFLFFSVSVTMLAFAATIVLVIHLKKRWTTTLLYTAAFLPVTVFALLQFPLYVASMSTLKFSLRLIKNVLPTYLLPRRFHKTDSPSIYKTL